MDPSRAVREQGADMSFHPCCLSSLRLVLVVLSSSEHCELLRLLAGGGDDPLHRRRLRRVLHTLQRPRVSKPPHNQPLPDLAERSQQSPVICDSHQRETRHPFGLAAAAALSTAGCSDGLSAAPAPSVSAILSLRPVRLLLRIPAIREMLVALAGSVASLGTLGP